ncbi:MAG: glycosyltransferase [Sedimentisphaerales bacterium]
MDSEIPFVSVVIPTYRDWERLQLCIDALAKQTYPADKFEILVINNDPSESALEAFCLPVNGKLFVESRVGSYAARNKGIKESRGQILAFTDSDCIPAPGWIENAVAILISGADRIGGKVELFYSSNRLNLAEKYQKAFAFRQENSTARGFSVTANMLTWLDVFDKVGLFDDLLMSGGDYEWGVRAYNAGFGITYSPNVIVRHPARHQLSALLHKRRRTTGGIAAIKKSEGTIEFLGRFARGFMPPIFGYMNIRNRTDLSVEEKICALCVLYLAKIYGAIHYFLSFLKLCPQKRC